MKAIRFSTMVGAGAILAASVALAAGPNPQPGQADGRCGRGGRMGQALGLTEAQKATIQPIMEKYRGQQQELRSKMQAEISSVLTPEQRDRLTKMREQRGNRQGMRGDRQGRRGSWQGRRFGRRHPDGKAMVQRLSQNLQLTPDQQQKVLGVFDAHRTAMRTLIEGARSGKVDRGQVREQAKVAREKLMADIGAVLTPEQQQKLQTLRQQHGPRRNG